MPDPIVIYPSTAHPRTAHRSAQPATGAPGAGSPPEVIPFPGTPAAPTGPTPPPAAALAVARHRERGQTTAEYALVLVGAATIAMLIVAWAGSTSRISGLFDTVIRSVTSLLA